MILNSFSLIRQVKPLWWKAARHPPPPLNVVIHVTTFGDKALCEGILKTGFQKSSAWCTKFHVNISKICDLHIEHNHTT